MLGLKDLNVSAALAGHKAFNAQAAKSPNSSYSQVLNRVAPNARQQFATLGSAVPTDILNPGVPMSQFRATLQKLKQANKRPLNNGFEITDKDQITESVNEALMKDEQNPPAMMVLRRQAIRIFPDGRRVALYTNKQLGLTFTIPYTPNGTQASTAIPGVQEEVEHIEENIDQLKKIADEKQHASLKFKNGSSMKIDHYTASAVHQLHNALNDENKAKVARMVSHSPEQFKKIADFALSKSTFKINK
jgi:hypothetical protein